MLIEIHVLQNHAPSNLNRDDTGSPKECMFGGVRRARISSQCLKRSLRRSDVFQTALAGSLGTRTRRLPEIIRERLVKNGIAADLAEAAAKHASGFGTSDGKVQAPGKDGKYATAQTVFLAQSDIEAVLAVLEKAIADTGNNVKKFGDLKTAELQKQAAANSFRAVPVDVALFGRMTTSEAIRDVEASCQVAHAISTHKVDHEFDYFTAVDDLRGLAEVEEDAGADMIGDVEYNSACYYKYFSLDADDLVRNLTGEGPYRRRNVSDADRTDARDLAAKAAAAFIKAVALVNPSGKQNSFAAHQRPAAILVEVRPYNTPTGYTNAFVDPVRQVNKLDGDLVAESLRRFREHIEAITLGFNLEASERLLLAPEHKSYAISGVEQVPDLNTLADRVAAAITGSASYG